MANVYAVKSGNWSDTTVWNTGALPASADNVWPNNFTVTVDISPTVANLFTTSSTGIAAGGTFSLASGVTLTAAGGISTGGINSVVFGAASPAVATLTASIQVVSGSSAAVVVNQSSGTFNINGNVGAQVGMSGTQYGVANISTGTINLVGNVNSNSGGSATGGLVANTSSGTLNITGNVVGSNINFVGVRNTSVGTVNITGTVTGGTNNAAGVENLSSGTINITGSCFGSNTSSNSCPAYINSSVGNIFHYGSATARNVSPAASGNTSGGYIYATGPLIGTPQGIPAFYIYRWRWVPSVGSSYMTVPNSTATGYKNLYTADSVGGNPAVTNVRSGTVYGPASELTGTCAVPAAASVAFGVPVDNTSGTATLTAANVRDAVGLASANLDTQLSGITSGISGLPSASAIASAVWAAATRTLTTAIDNSSTIAAAVWSYATGRTITGGTVDTLTNAPSVPSAATIASQVRTELSTELARIDVATSTRLAPSGTLARVTLTDTATTLTNAPTVPSASQIATQVRTELTPELARIANCATTQEVDDIVEGALS